jgi:hypothetical protein
LTLSRALAKVEGIKRIDVYEKLTQNFGSGIGNPKLLCPPTKLHSFVEELTTVFNSPWCANNVIDFSKKLSFEIRIRRNAEIKSSVYEGCRIQVVFPSPFYLIFQKRYKRESLSITFTFFLCE